jgi:prolyl 4-hydroxylase
MNNKNIFFIILFFIIIIVSFILFFNYNNSYNFLYGLDNKEENFTYPIEIHNFLQEDECNYIISKTVNDLKDATVGGTRINSKTVRNNKVAWLDVNMDDPVVNKIYDKISNILGVTRNHCESIQIAKYGQNEFYKHHYDQCYDFNSNNDCKILLEEVNYIPRKYTLLIYLNKDYENGFTDFPYISKKYRPKNIGDAILFNSLNKNDNMVHKFSYHSGTDVTKGEKWIANIWIHSDKIR